MTDFHAIDALLADAREPVALPPVEQRRALRQALNLSRVQVAQALGVSPSTLGGWEAGREPSGDLREKYAYFLQAAEAKLRTQAEEVRPRAAEDEPRTQPPGEHPTARPAPSAPAPAPASPSVSAGSGSAAAPCAADSTAGDDTVLPAPRPCVLCGAPATHHIEGYPQHLDPAECVPAGPRSPAGQGTTGAGPAPTAAGPEPIPVGQQPVAPQSAATVPAPAVSQPGRSRPAPAQRPVRRRASQTHGHLSDLIHQAVHDALAAHGGDTAAATAGLQRRAIPDAMALLDVCRIGARYDIVGHPPLPGILRKKSAHGADEVWEARPNWTRPEAPLGTGEVTALDINGAYLSALKTHLPLGALEHSTGDAHSRRRAGIHLITPPDWDHHSYLPNPLGNRDEPGPVWVTEPVLRLLQRLATAPYGPMCDPPVIHESWTSGATEQLFEKFRQVLRDARDKAITDDDEVTLEYVKSMYSKFVSTMGESNFNREICRPDWMHIIRSQAFVNLWLKAHKAHTAGLHVIRVMGTDELHLVGDWRHVFTEGRGVTEVKVKDTYTLPARER
ncbi:helix-turn-helix domain-containing protein [Streptomyces nogalater]|uniref:Helix-turn-helix domain-containing protein n=1 Tax=Streptomyces nogalater TaxID=38314 RepID=A0ABW0WTS1_STRNO